MLVAPNKSVLLGVAHAQHIIKRSNVLYRDSGLLEGLGDVCRANAGTVKFLKKIRRESVGSANEALGSLAILANLLAKRNDPSESKTFLLFISER